VPVAKFKKQGDAVQLLSVEKMVEALPPEPARGYMPEAQSDSWGTPLDLFRQLDDEFHFTLDTAASQQNTLCERFYTKEQDALKQPWEGRVWLNPPYGREVERWIAKARAEVDSGKAELSVLLLKSTTETIWWHKYVWDLEADGGAGGFRPGARARFLKGRLTFDIPGQPKHGPAPFSSVVVVFTPVPA